MAEKSSPAGELPSFNTALAESALVEIVRQEVHKTGLKRAVLGVSGWSWPQALWLLPLGLFASLGQLSMTKAYSIAAHHGGTLLVANLQYSGVVFAALYGVLLFGDNIPLSGWLGMALIVASAIAATVLRARAAPNAPAEEH